MREHPKLAEKLRLLYKLKLNPALKSNVDVAKTLGISKQSISKWTRGTPTTYGQKIPDGQVDKLSEMFDVESLWWTLPLDQFEAKVQDRILERFAKPEDISLSFLPITNSEVFGRDNDIEILDAAWRDTSVNVVQFTGFGGIGKSTIVAAWLSLLAKERYKGSKRVYAWSFYWQGASSDIKSSGDFFVEHALNWFGDPNPIQGTPWAKAGRLVRLVRASRTLLILDGLEPLQHRPGPRFGQIDNPAVALLVKELACENTGLCIITSRLPIADLAAYDDGRIKSHTIESLCSKSSVELLKSLGVRGSEEDFTKVVSLYSGHALSLSLLAGYLAVVHKGDLSRWGELRSLLDDKIQGGHARSLMQAYIGWFSREMEGELLYLVGMFDRAVSISDLASLCSTSDIPGLTSRLAKASIPDWLYAAKQLADSRILLREFRNGQTFLDCHPLVRDFLSEFLSAKHPEIWQQGNAAIFYHLQNQIETSPSSITDLEPLFRSVIHGNQAGLHEEAFSLYFVNIKNRYAMLTKGSHFADEACIRSFFVKEWDVAHEGLSEESKFRVIVSAATNLMSLGRIKEAIEPSYSSLKWLHAKEQWLEVLGLAGPLISMHIAAGQIKKALGLIEQLSGVANDTNNAVLIANGKSFLAYINHLMGLKEDAEINFSESDAVIIREKPSAKVTFPTISAYYCKFLLDTGNLDAALERALKTQAWREAKSWQVAIDTTSLLASDLMVLGLIFLARKDLVNAKLYLEKQVQLLQSADEWLYLPTGLNARSKYYLEIADFEAAHADLTMASEISIRTGARFSEWETYLNFAEFYIVQNKLDEAHRFYKKAVGLKGMSEYKFRDQDMQKIRLCLGLDDE